MAFYICSSLVTSTSNEMVEPFKKKKKTKWLKCRNGNVFIYYFGVIIEGKSLLVI